MTDLELAREWLEENDLELALEWLEDHWDTKEAKVIQSLASLLARVRAEGRAEGLEAALQEATEADDVAEARERIRALGPR